MSDAELIVIRASGAGGGGGGGDVEVTCGGLAVLDGGDDSPKKAILAGQEGSILLGKRYVDEGDTLELLCTKPGMAPSPWMGDRSN